MKGVLPETLTEEQRLAVWLAQYRLANSRLSEPKPDGHCIALAEERVADKRQRESDLAAWAALRETLIPEPCFEHAEELARLFHDRYESLAPSFGYETRPDTKAFDPHSANGRLMMAVCSEVVTAAVLGSSMLNTGERK
jgi:hypothetical protein